MGGESSTSQTSDHASGSEDPNGLYRALAAFTAAYLEHLAVEEGEALPALWQGCSDEELTVILVSFKSSRFDVENLTSLLARRPTLDPVEMNRMAAVGLPGSISEVAELLASLLEPRQLEALRAAQRAEAISV